MTTNAAETDIRPISHTSTNDKAFSLVLPYLREGARVVDVGAGEGYFSKMVGDLISPAPIDPNKPAPPVIKDVDNSDFIEMDLNLARIDGQLRSSWIVEPADGRLPFTEAGKKAAAEEDDK